MKEVGRNKVSISCGKVFPKDASTTRDAQSSGFLQVLFLMQRHNYHGSLRVK